MNKPERIAASNKVDLHGFTTIAGALWWCRSQERAANCRLFQYRTNPLGGHPELQASRTERETGIRDRWRREREALEQEFVRQ